MLKRSIVVSPWKWPASLWYGILAVVLLARFPLNFVFFPPFLMDFDVYYTIAQRISQGSAAGLYDPTTSDLMMFKYAPCWALFWLPLAWVSKQAAAVIWAFLTCVWMLLAMVGAARLCTRMSLKTPPWLGVAVTLLLVRSISAEFLTGQVNLLWSALIIGALVAQTIHRPGWSAFGFACAISLKLPALLFPIYWIFKKRWDLLLRTSICFGLINGIAAFLLLPHEPLALFRNWLHVLWSSGQSRAFEIGNQTLLSLMGRFFSEDAYHLNILNLPQPALWGLAATVSFFLFSSVLIGPKTEPTEEESSRRSVYDASLLIVLMVLCSPTAWISSYSALILPVTVAIASSWSSPQKLIRVPAWGITMALLLALSAMTHSSFWRFLGILYFRRESYVFLVLMILPWFSLTVFALVWCQRRSCS